MSDFNEFAKLLREVTDLTKSSAGPNACFLMLRPELQGVVDAAMSLVRGGDVVDPELREELTGDLCSSLAVLNVAAAELREKLNA